MRAEKPVNMALGEELLKQIDDWRFANRVDSRVEAVRRLVRIALEYTTKEIDDDDTYGRERSGRIYRAGVDQRKPAP